MAGDVALAAAFLALLQAAVPHTNTGVLLPLLLQAIVAAHEDLAPAAVSYAAGQLLGANINRSPTAYLANPAAERAAYEYDVDKDMELLRIKHASPGTAAAVPAASSLAAGPAAAAAAAAAKTAGAQHVAADIRASSSAGSGSGSGSGSSSSGGISSGNEEVRGMISWFPVHCTSMNNSNPYMSGDNKGAAAQLVEKARRARHAMRPDAVRSSSSSSSSRSEQVSGRSRVGACRASAVSCRSWLGWHWQLLKCLLSRKQPAASAAAADPGAAITAASVVGQAGGFVAAFAQSSVGDTSPNVQGAFCLDTGVHGR
jgi:hypothetical protein